MSIAMIGLDTAKTTFQVHGVDETGKVEIKRKLRRNEVVGFFATQPACTVVLEACAAAHHWGRVLETLGHTVKLVAPEAVRPFVKRGRKNDAADASALCEVARRPEVKFVPVKSVEQQATLALHAARALLVKQQTMLSNALRGLAAEFGLIVPQGFVKLEQLMGMVEAENQAILPEPARQSLKALYRRFCAMVEEATMLEKAIGAHAREDATARRLATIPGVGPITASLIAATVTDIGLFRSARHFAAWLGLGTRGSIPRVARRGSGGSPRQGAVQSAPPWSSGPQRWSIGLVSGTAQPGPGYAVCWDAAPFGWPPWPWRARSPRRDVPSNDGGTRISNMSLLIRQEVPFRVMGKSVVEADRAISEEQLCPRARAAVWCPTRKRTPMVARGDDSRCEIGRT